MTFTVFSFITSALVSTLVLIGVHLLRRNLSFVKGFGTKAVLLGYFLCLARMLFTPEFPFTRILSSSGAAGDIYEACYTMLERGSKVSYLTICLAVWLGVAGILIIIFSAQYILGLRRIRRCAVDDVPDARRILRRIQDEYPRKVKAEVFVCSATSVPMGVGLLSKKILLPLGDFSETELYHMIKHEYIHFYNRDLTVKFLVMIFCCVFWWNPLVYLLNRDVAQMLEVKCDLTVTEGYEPEKIEEYMYVIVGLLKEPDEGNSSPLPIRLGMARERYNKAIVERFAAITKPVTKASKMAKTAVVALFFVIFALSYTVVVQPYYEPPIDETMLQYGTTDVNLNLEGYILKTSNGDYFMCSPGESPWPLQKETVEVFSSMGIEIKEERPNEVKSD